MTAVLTAPAPLAEPTTRTCGRHCAGHGHARPPRPHRAGLRRRHRAPRTRYWPAAITGYAVGGEVRPARQRGGIARLL